jgi:hypothetical protein
MLCGTTEAQFSNFQNHFREAQLCRPGRLPNLRDNADLPSLLQKSSHQFFGGKSENACETRGSPNFDQPQDAEVVA